MLGCHDLEGYEETIGAEASYDFNVTVSKHSAVGRSIQSSSDDQMDRTTTDTFQIKRNGVQKFYTLNGTKFTIKTGMDNNYCRNGLHLNLVENTILRNIPF